jgi:thiaminase
MTQRSGASAFVETQPETWREGVRLEKAFWEMALPGGRS